MSISLPFYEQLLHLQIPKAQKESQVVNLFLRSQEVHAKKAARKTLMKLTLGAVHK
jgi:hypothetical protein